MRSFINGVAYSLGLAHPIDDLFIGDPTGADFYKARGLLNYRAQSASTLYMCRAAIVRSLQITRSDPTCIGTVIVDSDYWHCSAEDRIQILESLQQAGISQVPVLGLGLQTCSGCMSAFDLADRLVRTDAAERAVLILLCGRAAPGASRVDALRSTILSDGVAACVASNKREGYQLLATASYTALDAVRANTVGDKPLSSLLKSYAGIAALARSLYSAAGTGPEEIDALLCTNGSLTYTTFAADAARVPVDRVYTDNIADCAHIFSCDHLISLATRGARPGEKFLLLAWSPYVYSGAILQAVEG
jgi:hypothetical protein